MAMLQWDTESTSMIPNTLLNAPPALIQMKPKHTCCSAPPHHDNNGGKICASGQAMVNRKEDRPANRELRPITRTWHARQHTLPHNDTIEWRSAPKSALGTTYTSYTSSTAGTKPLVQSYDGMLVNIHFSH